MTFKESLERHLAGVLDPAELALLPRGFQTLEDVAIINLKPALLPRKHEIGQAYLDLLPYIKSVWAKTFGSAKVTGQFREPTGLEHIAGIAKHEVMPVENGVTFKHDFTKVIFSKGNINERSYLPTLVKDGEIILDMFAGIGYFSLMIAKHARPATIHAIEINPVSHAYLVENITLNGARCVVPHLGNCAAIVPHLVQERDVHADRIIMGVFPAPAAYLPVAFQAVKRGTGTIIHYEGEVENKDVGPLLAQLREAIDGSPLVSSFEVLETRFVKNTGIRKQHCVLDVRVS